MIDVINLKKSFGDVEVLKGIDMTINKGDIVAIIGPSGSGKSTFLRCLNCMEDPTSGQIIFNGVDIADMKVDINIHRRHMGMVFQHFNLFNNKTVIENIMLAPVHTRCQDLKKAKRKKLFGKGEADASLAGLTKDQIKKEEKEKAKKEKKQPGFLSFFCNLFLFLTQNISSHYHLRSCPHCCQPALLSHLHFPGSDC